MPVVGTLTVDLVANTATFTADLGKAGNSLDGFGKSAEAAGNKMDYSMREAKGSMMLMGEELGIHIPRHLQTLIAGIPAVGAAFAELLPLIGVIAAIAIIEKLIAKNEEAKEKLSQGWDKFGVEAETVFGDLDDKMLKVGKTADELAGRHLAALRKELELIDHASLRELAAEFGKLEKAGHTLMVEMKSSWYEIRMGSQGAENALTRFTGEYDLLLAKGDKKGAFDKLVGTLGSANEELKKMVAQEGTMYAPSQKLVDSQRLLVSILEDQLAVTKEVSDINAGEKTNAKTGEAQAEAGRQEAIYNAQQTGLEKRRKAEERYAKERLKLRETAAKEDERIAEEEAKATEAVAAWEMKVQQGLANETLKQTEILAKLKLKADDEAAKHRFAMGQSSRKQAYDAEVKAAQDGTKIDVDALNARIAALNKSDNEYLVKLKAFENEKQRIEQLGAQQVKAIQNKEAEDVHNSEQRMRDEFAKTAAQSIIQGKNMLQAFEQVGAQMLQTVIENMLKQNAAEDVQQVKDAGHAAASAFKWAIQGLPFPVNAVVAPVAAAAAFAGVMAFETGGEIPGSGPVPIIAHGGETVVTKALSDQVKSGSDGGRRGTSVTNNFKIATPDANSFKHSQGQIQAKAHLSASKLAKRNGGQR
jgi:hypothetical protein